ncbi:MAG: esterase, partial [Ramlibacter sp.]|nr:esterase [Ramlibacter sp.]
MPATFVLVHGAWHGGWCWRRVADRLLAAGARVYAPTLTGLADRSHLLSPGVGLHTHVDDIVNLLRWEQLDDVVLVGHSYGGMVCGGVLAAERARIKSLVLVDAFVPEDGKSLLDISGPAARARFEALRYETAAGPCIPPVAARAFRVNEADADWVDRQCTPQPFKSFVDVLPGPLALDDVKTRIYLRAAAYPQASFETASQQLAGRGWQVHHLPH